MSITLHDKYSKEIAEAYNQESFLKARLSNDYDFNGVRTVKISTPVTVPMNDYTRSGGNRYGTPAEMGDTVQELTLSQDKSFSITIDKGNNMDQNNIKPAGTMLRLQIREQAVPEMDRYGFLKLCHSAGTIFGNSTAISKTTVARQIMDGSEALDNAEVPSEGRTLFVPANTFKFIKLSDEFGKAGDTLGMKAYSKGIVGSFDGMDVVKVPSGRWPKYCNFIITHRSAAVNPVKLEDTNVHIDPPGISGNLLEGREYYDLFVIGARAYGVYAEIDTGSNKGTVCVTPTVTVSLGTATLACSTAGTTIVYTTDGTDPRFSRTAITGTSLTVLSGDRLRVYAYKNSEGFYPSAVLDYTVS